MVKHKKEELLAKIAEEEKLLAELVVKAKEIDPFGYWIPNDGIITDDGREVLRKYLKEEDIPDKVDSQLDRLLCRSEVVGVSGGNRSSKTNCDTIDGIIKSTGELPYSMEKYGKEFEDVIKKARSKIVKGRATGVDNKQLHRVVLPMW